MYELFIYILHVKINIIASVHIYAYKKNQALHPTEYERVTNNSS